MFRLWFLVIGAFMLLIAAWTSLIVVATKFAPEQIPVKVRQSR